MAEAERRGTYRLAISGELHGEVMVFQPMTIKEISTDGIQVETAIPLQLDSLHDLRLALDPTPVVVKGRVVHSRVSDVEQGQVVYKSGLEFVAPPTPVAEAILAFVAQLQAERGSR
jgi:hypothetical protein